MVSLWLFFQDNWDLLKVELEGVFKEFFERGIMNRSIVETFVCLIPEKENANRFRASDLLVSSLVFIRDWQRFLQIAYGKCFLRPFFRRKELL